MSQALQVSYALGLRVENAVTLEEIARIAGVSRSTVSRVVNGDRRVSDAARQRVQGVIRDHDYHPHAAARSLASRRMRVLGLLITKSVGGLFTDPFYPILIQGAADACNAADHTLTMLMDTSADGHAVDQLYGRVIRGRHVDGVVLACQTVDDPLVPRLQSDGIPFVLVGRHPGAEVSFVDVDSRGAAQGAVAHLIGHGYRKIAMICGQPCAGVRRHGRDPGSGLARTARYCGDGVRRAGRGRAHAATALDRHTTGGRTWPRGGAHAVEINRHPW